MTDREVLAAARELISDKNRWCQGSEAEDAAGRWILPSHLNAVRWCALGAVEKVSDISRALDIFADTMDVININDDMGHEAILAYLDARIEEMQ